MKKLSFVLILLVSFVWVRSQRIQAIVPSQVVQGNAFQIQYIINEPSDFLNLIVPEFDNLKLISGPNYYKGNSLVNGKKQPIENITYTVVPTKAGLLTINAITARFKNNEEEQSDEVTINVLPQPKASFNARSTYTDINLYAPSRKTDLDRLIAANLFIKTEVDKRICYLGEAITATFKLYSRLQSTSEVVNAPSLYGFSVMDILNINESHQSVETINGKIFNTSVLRKLRLYPAHAGTLTIDEMQLQNTIEFNDSVTGKTIKLEKLLASNAVNITAKLLPGKEPTDFSGAVGHFTIEAHLENKKIAVNGLGKLLVTAAGRGNFIQFSPPVISWPKDFDVFEPVASDELNKNAAPTEGKRLYVFSFTCDHTGKFSIPPVSFSFFDISLARYKTIRTDSINFEIAETAKPQSSVVEKQTVPRTKNLWIAFVLAVAICLLAVMFFLRTKRKEVIQTPTKEETNHLQKHDAILSRKLTGKQYCLEIGKLFNDLNNEHQLSYQSKQELIALQKECQLLIYSDIDFEEKKDELQKRIDAFLNQFNAGHSAYL
jgi:hypothetical protein